MQAALAASHCLQAVGLVSGRQRSVKLSQSFEQRQLAGDAQTKGLAAVQALQLNTPCDR